MGQGVGVVMAVLKYCTYVKINSPLAGWLWGARQGKKGLKENAVVSISRWCLHACMRASERASYGRGFGFFLVRSNLVRYGEAFPFSALGLDWIGLTSPLERLLCGMVHVMRCDCGHDMTLNASVPSIDRATRFVHRHMCHVA